MPRHADDAQLSPEARLTPFAEKASSNPLKRGRQPLRPLSANFRVDLVSVRGVPNPYLDALHQRGDQQDYAKRYVAFLRAFTESTLRRALFEPGAVGEPVDGTTDRFYTELQRRTAADPQWSVFEDWTLTIALTRTDDSS